ncbi:hypothetical protein HN670_00610 [bacterium]|jgi:photosystem II stability/assembly factor-like uncharacterized protein|nr:hypothetical protein [bacterium]
MVVIKNRFVKITTLVLILPIFLSGCISVSSKNTSSLGGFFLTNDQGENWGHRTSMYVSDGEPKTFSGTNITKIAFDPQDEEAIYLGTQNNGIFYSYNYGKGWHSTLAYKGTVNDIVVHPQDKCTVYAAAHNKIWKTEDCSRTWTDIYFESRNEQYVTSLNINYANPDIIYAGTSGGSFLRSLDRGKSWDVLRRFDNSVKQIVVQNHSDSNIIYAITKSTGVFRSGDGGVSWENLMALPVYKLEVIKEGDRTFTAIKQDDEDKPFFKISGVKISVAADSDRSLPDSLIYGNRIGMFRFLGDHWEQYSLLTPDKKETIYSTAVNPLDGNDFYYGTSKALYHTIDGGANWVIKELPTNRVAGKIAFSPNNEFLYLGAYKISK